MPLWFLLALISGEPAADASRSDPSRSDTVTIAAIGHVVPATDWPPGGRYLPSGDGTHLVAAVAELVRGADVAIANLAAPIASVGAPKAGHNQIENFAFRTPPQYAAVLTALGLDVVQAANNHTLDFGPEADAETLAVLARLGIAHIGRVGEVYRRTVRGIRVAALGFTQPYAPTFQSNRDLPAAGRLVASVAATSDLVLVMIHGGAEGEGSAHVPRGPEYLGGEYRGRLVELARHLVDQGADLVTVVGPHQPRALELYRGRIIDYGLGCFLGYGPFDIRKANGFSLVLEVTLDRGGNLVQGRIVPLIMAHPGVPSPDTYGWGLGLIRRLSRADFPESAPRIGRDGAFELARDASSSRPGASPRSSSK